VIDAPKEGSIYCCRPEKKNRKSKALRGARMKGTNGRAEKRVVWLRKADILQKVNRASSGMDRIPVNYAKGGRDGRVEFQKKKKS